MTERRAFDPPTALFHDTQGQDRLLQPPTSRARNWKLIAAASAVGVGVIALVSGVRHWHGTDSSVDRDRLTIATVERGSFVRDIVAEGQVVAAGSPTLYAPSAGSVTLRAHAGDTVTQGQRLAVIDSPDLSAKLSQEEATLQALQTDWQRARLDADRKTAQLLAFERQAQIDQNTAQRELDRSRRAHELGSYSELHVLKAQDELEKATFAYEQARSNYEQQPQQNRFDIQNRKALLDRQQYLVADLQRQITALQIQSPVTGQVGQVQVADRASVAKDTPLLTVIDLSALEVEIKVPESLARDLAPGMSADLEGGNRHWKGIVSAVSPQVVNGEVTSRLRFDAQTPEGLRQNQRLSVRIFIDRRNNVLMVDRGLFLDQDGGGFVYVVQGDIAERRPVHLGVAGLQKVEILGGLVAGDRIVISGTDAFHGAQRVYLNH